MENMILSATYSDSVGGMASHLHDCHQLLYIQKGEAQITVSNRVYRGVPGTMVLISRFETHSISVTSPEYCRYTLQIDPQAVNMSTPEASRLLALLVNRPQHFHHAIDLQSQPEVEMILQHLVEEQQQERPMGNELKALLFLQLLIRLVRACPSLLDHHGKNLNLIRQVQIYLENHYRNKLTLEEIAREHHVSPSYLSHQFKKITGISVMGYLLSCRLATAKKLLANSRMEIAAVMEESGFSDSSNFSRTFKAETGLTPSGFRSHFQT